MTTRRPRPTIPTLLVLIMTILAPTTAWAQGTFGTLPDPVSARDLTRYADRMGLSDQQRLAIEMFHLEYGDAFRRLRETDIEEFVQESSGMRFGMQLMADPSTLNTTIRELERIMGRIESLDRRLFDDIQTMLTEEQTLELNGVRLARQRTRQRSGLGRFARFINPAARVDISEIYADLDLSPTAHATGDPIMDRYESQLTAKTARVYDGSLDLARKLPKQIEDAGIDLGAMMGAMGGRGRGGRGNRGGDRGGDRGGEDTAAAFEALTQIWTKMMADLTKMTEDISDLNRKTADEMERLLPGDDGWTLTTRFYGEGYDGTAADTNPADEHLRAALRLDTLSAEQRQAVEGLVTTYRVAAMRLSREGADLIDDDRGNSSPFGGRGGFGRGGGRGGNRELRDKLEGMRDERTTLNERTIDQMFAVLDPEQAGAVESRVTSLESAGGGDGERDGRGRRGADRQRQRIEEATAGGGADPLVPTPITSQEVARYSTMLSIDDFLIDVVESLHADYMSAYRGVEDGELTELREARRTLWSVGEGGVEGPSNADRERIVTLRQRAIDRIKAIDADLIENLVALAVDIPETTPERVRLARDRVIYTRQISSSNERGGRGRRGGSRFGRGSDGEGSVDMAAIVAEAGLEDGDLQALDASLLDYERQVTSVFRTRYETNVRITEMFERGGRGNRGNFRETLQEDFRKSTESREQIAALNRGLLATIEQTLPDPASADIRQSYYRRAFADVYDDEQSAIPRLEAAMDLAGMSADQRMALAEVASDFRPRYEALCEQMVTVRTTESGGGDGNDWERRMAVRRDLDRIRADRDDLNHRTLIQLKALLDEEQERRLGITGAG